MDMTESSRAGQNDDQAQECAGTALIVLGQISGIYGVRGWVKIHSYTAPRENILKYTPWQIRASGRAVASGILPQATLVRPGRTEVPETRRAGSSSAEGAGMHMSSQEQLFGHASERPQEATGNLWRPVTVLDGRIQGKGIVAHLEGWDTPEAAQLLVGAEIAMPRTQLPVPAKGEYYWSDLIGLQVIGIKQGVDNTPLGTVDALMETGANDVLVVQALPEGSTSGKKHLIPFIDGVIVSVDLDTKVLRVNWDIDY